MTFRFFLVDSTHTKVHALEQWLKCMDRNLQPTRQSIEYTLQRVEKNADGHRKELAFTAGDQVLFLIPQIGNLFVEYTKI